MWLILGLRRISGLIISACDFYYFVLKSVFFKLFLMCLLTAVTIDKGSKVFTLRVV